ncbi:SMP-30/gluconolactonase/LRE family protein [Saccharopolyspora rhizosphaerae]|uniref:SMP-30/gluconolactonase/LRE family protein n=1 Tax=Saccharopolyspora rhizosphaerae TaxID=2492662 RepID=A0A426JRD6_9PSEU|nr:SMP-30/gluconolactonase/LRE family protein [Saccharopolyspora rhizosphaerae]RRO15704.1 SMP-30/gluconolactonase/LRE family protein [Saccharopolyspora rhizosphaerae]
MHPQVDIAVAATARSGQAPTWDFGTETLLWTDPLAGGVHRFRPGGTNATMTLQQRPGGAKPRTRGGLVLHLEEGVALFDAHGEQRTWLVYWAREGMTAAATMVDRRGRMWATTMREDESGDGWLVRVGADGSAGVVIKDLEAGLGLATSPDDACFYVADAGTHRIEVLDFDVEAGLLSNRRTLCEVGGQPSGLAVDTEGTLWTAVRDKGELHRYAPSGELTGTIPLPAQRPTNLCFGGQDLRDLYITTARDGLPSPTDQDGSVLTFRAPAEGLRTYAFTG